MMSKKYCKNESNQSNRRKDIREFVGKSKRLNKQSHSAFKNELDFLNIVSSSGTKLNKRIEQEKAKLETIEKKIRRQKCESEAMCKSPSPENARPSNRCKLRHVLENMLATMDSAIQKPRAADSCRRKIKVADNDNANSVKKITKLKKPLINTIAIESLKCVSINKAKKMSTKVEPSKNVLLDRNSKGLKRLSSAPIDNLTADLRFAENFKLGKRAILNINGIRNLKFTLQNIKEQNSLLTPKNKTVQIDNNNKITEDATMIFETMSKINYLNNITNDSTYLHNECSSLLAAPNSSDIVIGSPTTIHCSTYKKSDTKNYKKTRIKPLQSQHSNNKTCEESKADSRPKNLEKKRFYSFLKRGNFTISHHCEATKDDGNESNEKTDIEENIGLDIIKADPALDEVNEKGDDRNQKEKKEDIDETPHNLGPSELTEIVPSNTNLENAGVNPSINAIKYIKSGNINARSSICVCPTELLERSIRALENVLRTIDSMTNQFDTSSEIKVPCFPDIPLSCEIEDSSTEQLFMNTDSINYCRNTIRKYLGNTETSQISLGLDTSRHFSTKKSSSLDVKLRSPEVEIIHERTLKNLSSAILNSEMTLLVQESETKELVFLKPAIKCFYESKEILSCRDKVFNEPSLVNARMQKNSLKHTTEFAANYEEVNEPLKKAMKSFQTGVNVVRGQVKDELFKKIVSRPVKSSCTAMKSEMLHWHFYKRGNVVNTSLARKRVSGSCNTILTTNTEGYSTNQNSSSFSRWSENSRSNSYEGINTSSCMTTQRCLNSVFSIYSKMKILSASKILSKSSKIKGSNTIPDTNFKKCLNLLGKKFKDFEASRNKKLIKWKVSLKTKNTDKTFYR